MCPHIPPWALFLAATLAGIGDVDGVDIYTGGSVEARNGTEQRLRCTFQSSSPVGKQTTVSWNFRPFGDRNEVSVFYYHEQPYPSVSGRFKGRLAWSGDIWRKDGSITITELRFTDNGTFLCSVKNPPDVDGVVGEITLSVVYKVTYSEMQILGIVIGGATSLVVVIVIVVVMVQLCRKRRETMDAEMREEEHKYESKNGSISEQSLILTREEARF
uniref:myelin protein zero-like protein 2 isoform X2 n=1 Tax=Pristiophorus japonicus TaxID=55135 RepID=UPI00398F6519